MTWLRERAVCVVCPSCAFTFDAMHTDDCPDREDRYSCPVCGEIEL